LTVTQERLDPSNDSNTSYSFWRKMRDPYSFQSHACTIIRQRWH